MYMTRVGPPISLPSAERDNPRRSGHDNACIERPNDNWNVPCGCVDLSDSQSRRHFLRRQEGDCLCLGGIGPAMRSMSTSAHRIRNVPESNPLRAPPLGPWLRRNADDATKPMYMGADICFACRNPVVFRRAATLTFSWSKNGVDFFEAASWPSTICLANLGDISAQQLEFEVGEYGPAATSANLCGRRHVSDLNSPGSAR
jgi:hypothetical protein